MEQMKMVNTNNLGYSDVCDMLNSYLPATNETISNINEIIEEHVFHKGGELYFGRQLWISCNFDDVEVKDKIYTDEVIFTPSDDIDEHPGIVLKLKTEA